MPNIKIIIPSIGRGGLTDSIKAISTDAEEYENGNVHVLIISDGVVPFEINTNQISNLQSVLSPNLVIEHFLNPKKGVSAALNYGLSFITADDLFMIFTDDDEWVHARIRTLTLALRDFPSADIILSQALLNDENGIKLRPRIQIDSNQNILDYLYGREIFLENPVYFSLVTCIARGKVSKVRFREQFSSHEDVVWLAEVQARNFRISGISETTAKLNVSLGRSSARMNSGADKPFLEWLEETNSKVFSNYVWVHAQRANSSQGNFVIVLKSFIKAIKTSKPTPRQVLISIFLTCLALVRRIKKSIP